MPDDKPAHPRTVSFDRVAAEYEETRFLPESIAIEMARFVSFGLRPTDWILDAGIGTGRLGRALIREHPRTIGVDVSPVMMRRVVEGMAGDSGSPSLTLADLRALPFAGATFARILTVHVLHLIPDWRQALSEMWRVLAPEGELIFGVEDRQPTEVREYFLRHAEERGLLPPRIGAHSAEVRTELERLGGEVNTHRPEEMRWQREVPIRATLKALKQRTYSILWEMPEAAHQELVEATENFARERFGTLERAETVTTQILLFVAVKG
jgi:ubiquinone/menaquinone biosynthesis C-methylase UbiE